MKFCTDFHGHQWMDPVDPLTVPLAPPTGQRLKSEFCIPHKIMVKIFARD